MVLVNTEQRENFFNEMKKLYTIVRTETFIKSKYDKNNYFDNYKDLCIACTSLIRNHRLDLLYLWHQDENDEKHYAIPIKQEELNNEAARLLDVNKVKNTELEFGEIFPTIYIFAFIVVRCLIMIRDVNKVKSVDYYSQTPKGGVDNAIVAIHNSEILPMFEQILIEKGEEGVVDVNIDEQLNDLINLALLVVANSPSFRWHTTDADFIKKMLMNEKPLKELVAE